MTIGINTNEYANWLRSEIDTHVNYHNHKETMAWTATAFFLPGIIGLAYVANLIPWRVPGHVAFSVLLILLTIAVLGFVSMQHKMRFRAADICDGLRRALARVCAGIPPLLQADLEVEDGKVWPRFVQSGIQSMIDRSNELKTRAKFLRAFLEFFRFKWDRIDNRIRTEIASYSAIIIVASAAFISIWK